MTHFKILVQEKKCVCICVWKCSAQRNMFYGTKEQLGLTDQAQISASDLQGFLSVAPRFLLILFCWCLSLCESWNRLLIIRIRWEKKKKISRLNFLSVSGFEWCQTLLDYLKWKKKTKSSQSSWFVFIPPFKIKLSDQRDAAWRVSPTLFTEMWIWIKNSS